MDSVKLSCQRLGVGTDTPNLKEGKKNRQHISNKVIFFLFCGREEVPLIVSTQPIHKESEAAAPKEIKIKKETGLDQGWEGKRRKVLNTGWDYQKNECRQMIFVILF